MSHLTSAALSSMYVDQISPRMIITRIPANIDQMAIVRKSCYGLPLPMISTRLSSLQASQQPLTLAYYTRKLSTNVDDGNKAVFNHRPLFDHLVQVLEERYGTLKKSPLTGFTGTTFTKHANGAFTRSQEGYILRFLESVNVKDLKIDKVPSDSV